MVKQKMKSMQLTKLRTIEPMEMEKPQPKSGWVLVKVMHTGICGSDLHYYEHGRIGNYIVDYPFLLGHESAGQVVEIGEGVTNLSVGDIVTMEPGYTCGKCEFCKTGRYNLCPNVVFFATPPVQGTLCEYVAHPADMCFKLPTGVSTLEGALIEPLSVGFHACNQGSASPGKTAAVLGSGCIGLCTMMALNYYGVNGVFITDMIDLRLQKASELGGITIDAGNVDVVEYIIEATVGRGTDIVIDTTGNAKAAASTAHIVARGGTVVMVGLSPDPVFEYDFGTLMDKEARINTVFRYRNLYPTAISAVQSGLPLDAIVSHIYGFEESAQAFAFNSANKAEVVKAVLEY
jgi:L-iditol 2-dehydrogenase